VEDGRDAASAGRLACTVEFENCHFCGGFFAVEEVSRERLYFEIILQYVVCALYFIPLIPSP
jgi:hypothetical protein